MTVHVPSVVAQDAGLICAPSVIKLITVPLGMGLPRRSEAIMVNVEVTPSMSQPSILKVWTLSEKKSWVGSPVVIVNVLDWLRIAGSLCTFAITQTGVGTVPELTEVVTSPLTSDVAEAAESVIHPER